MKTIASLRKGNNNEQIYNINNTKRNRNTNNNGNNNDNVRFLMTKILIIVIMEELVITIITVIELIYRRNSMEKKEKEKESKQANKLDLIKNLVRETHIEIILLSMSQTLNGNVKNCYRKKKFKTIGYIALFMDHYPRNG